VVISSSLAHHRSKSTLLRIGWIGTRHPQREAVQLRNVYACEHESVEGDGRIAFTGGNGRKRGGRC
jgi:hypothetical protein